MTKLISAIQFAIYCAKLYYSYESGITYVSGIRFGCPTAGLLFAKGRGSWQLSMFAQEYLAMKGTNEKA